MTIQDLGAIGEFVAAIATIVTLIYVAIQLRARNRLARAEASRAPNSDLNAINASFGTDPAFRTAYRKVLDGATRTELDPDDRTLVDFYLISMINIHEQLAREVRSGVIDPATLDFGANAVFQMPYCRTSWALYRDHLSSQFVVEAENRYGLDPSLRVEL